MKRTFWSSLAAAVLLAVLCSGAWAANIIVGTSTKELTDGNNYIVDGSVTIVDRIEVKGSVTLTLNDGCELNARDGIHVPGGSSLTIKTPSGPAGSGKLMADLRNETWGKAAIGGNRDGSTGTIRIEGGYITVRGGYASAGIGGAPGCGNGTIIITGGTIYAQGQSDGAGIGGGERGGGGTIRIDGGTINAIGGMMAAGIGGGQHRNAGDITITGGTIYAKGGEWAAGIGGGDSGDMEGSGGNNISISGGKITAIGGGRGGHGIGGGDRASGGRLSSDEGGTAWIETDSVNANMDNFRTGIIFIGNEGTVYGSPTIQMDVEIKRDHTLKIADRRTLRTMKGVTLTVARGSVISVESGSSIANDGSIVNSGVVRLPAGTNIKAINMIGSGTVEMGGHEYNNYGGDVLRGAITLDADRSYSVSPAVMEGAKLTIPQGVTLTMEGSAKLVNFGQIVNMGTVILPAGTDISDIKKIGMLDDMAKDIYGIVKIGDNSYASDGGDIVTGTKTLREMTTIKNGTWRLMNGARLNLNAYVYLNIRPGQRLIVHDGAKLSISNTSHGIRNEGIMRLPADTDITKLRLGGPGYILMGGKTYDTKGKEVAVNIAMPKPTTPDEEAAIESANGRYAHSRNVSGVRAAAEEDQMEGRVRAKMGDILIYKDDAEESLCAMRVAVAAAANEYAVIAKGQMIDAAYGDDGALPDGTIVYVAHFTDPNDETRTANVKFDKVPATEAGWDDLDLTTLIVNGKASEEVQQMPEYIPSGLAAGQGLAVYWDEETKVYVLVIFDGNDKDDAATAHIYAKADSDSNGSSSGACTAGEAALIALIGLAAVKRRAK